MGFSSGSIATQRFAVSGDQPAALDEGVLDAAARHALRAEEDGISPEENYGWSGGRHILDQHFDFEHNVFNDALSFALRVDTNRVPSELKRAYQIMEEEAVAAGNPSGFISKQQKRDVRAQIGQKLEDEMKSGRFRRSKLSPVLWDLPTRTVFSPASGNTAGKLMELFERSFELALTPMSAGTLALSMLQQRGRRRDYEDLRPTRFVYGPDGEGQWPEYPWAAKGPQPKDFLGNEFLLWLWHEADERDGMISTEKGDMTIFIDRLLDLDCAYGQSGRDGLRGSGPWRMPEARDGLLSGKVPRKAGLILEAQGQQFNFTLNAETLAVSALKLPEVEEADTPRTLFEERITLLRDFWKGIDAMFESFLATRCSSTWENKTGQIRKWIVQSAPKPMVAVA